MLLNLFSLYVYKQLERQVECVIPKFIKLIICNKYIKMCFYSKNALNYEQKRECVIQRKFYSE